MKQIICVITCCFLPTSALRLSRSSSERLGIIVPTYGPRLSTNARNFMTTYVSQCVDLVPLFFITSNTAEKDELTQIIDSDPRMQRSDHRSSIRVLAFEPDLLKQGDMILPDNYAGLECQGHQKKYAYQTNKKLYAARALRLDKWMFMDDETVWTKPTSITLLFRQHWNSGKPWTLFTTPPMNVEWTAGFLPGKTTEDFLALALQPINKTVHDLPLHMRRSFWFVGLPYSWFFERDTFDAFWEHLHVVNDGKTVAQIVCEHHSRHGIAIELQTLWLYAYIMRPGSYNIFSDEQLLTTYGIQSCNREANFFATIANCINSKNKDSFQSMMESPDHPFHVVPHKFSKTIQENLGRTSVLNITVDLDH